MAAGPEQHFKVTPEQLEAAITPRTRLLMINSPSNPTGAVYPRAVVEAIARTAREWGVWLIADDLYEHLIYEGTFTPVQPLYPEGTLTVHGASKGFALTGWRIGWGVGPQPLIKGMTRLQGQITSGANALAQHATVAALTEVEKTEAFLRETRAAYRERRQVLVDGLSLHDEELTRAGLEVTRTYQLARWLGGSTHLWAGRRAGLGRGEGRSGLRFDYLDEPDPDQAEGR